MGRIVLVTGGSRSGKSGFALSLGESLAGPRLFIATSPVTDKEMEERINQHRADRDSDKWNTLEEETALAEALRTHGRSPVILVDCVTLWINNLLYHSGKQDRIPDESRIGNHVREVIEACRANPGTTIFVTNEVGMGIVPEDRETRLYRDMIGRCNQLLGVAAHTVVLTVCGVPTIIKGELNQ